MIVINARNVNDAFDQGVAHFSRPCNVLHMQSRAGNVLESVAPITTMYAKPYECVLWNAGRDCNPFFHLFEAFWMLAGRNDRDYLTQFNKRMGEYAEGDGTFHGAYGYRWRRHFAFDQIVAAIKLLRADSMTRRCVISMWDPFADLSGAQTKDHPCNLMIKFEARRGVLDMTVFNRSNDMIWGAYGANAVHMSVLQQFVAAMVGIPVGLYYQVSANAHVYEDVFSRSNFKPEIDLYAAGEVCPTELFTWHDSPATVLARIVDWVAGGARFTGVQFIDDIADALQQGWYRWKFAGKAQGYRAVSALPQCNDWVRACTLWMARRLK